MAPWRVALGSESPNQLWMEASIWRSSPKFCLLGLEGCLAFSFVDLCLFGDLKPADVRMRWSEPYAIAIPSSSFSFSRKCLKLKPAYLPSYRESILPSVSGSVFHGLALPRFPCRNAAAPFAA